jgi:hypothetical protein
MERDMYTILTRFPNQVEGKKWSSVVVSSREEADIWFSATVTLKSSEKRIVEFLEDDRLLQRVEL